MPLGNWANIPQLLSPCTIKPMLPNKRNHRNGKPTHCNQEFPPSHLALLV